VSFAVKNPCLYWFSGAKFNGNEHNSRYGGEGIGKGCKMKKLIIIMIILLLALYFALTSQKAQSFLDNLRDTSKVNLIQ
jgi:hypothetical protein